MANMIFGDLLIMGDESEIEKLLISIAVSESDDYAPNWNADSSIMSFHKIVPIPRQIIALESQEYISDEAQKTIDDWYKNNWGTKSDAHHVALNDNGPEELVIQFDTKWSIPIHVIHALQKKFMNLDISYTYLEPNFGLAGMINGDGDLKYFRKDDAAENSDYMRIYQMFFDESYSYE
jgi:hypothetical protein